MNSVHGVAKNFGFSGSSLTDPFYEDVDNPIDEPVLLDERKRRGDEQRGNAVCARPERLRYFFGVVAVQLTRRNAAADGGAQVIEAALSRLRLEFMRKLFGLDERHDIVVGI